MIDRHNWALVQKGTNRARCILYDTRAQARGARAAMADWRFWRVARVSIREIKGVRA